MSLIQKNACVYVWNFSVCMVFNEQSSVKPGVTLQVQVIY